MEKSEYITWPLTAFVGVILLFIILILFLTRVDTFLKYKGINDCAKISTFEKTETSQGIKVAYPLQDFYKSCLKDKEIQQK